MSRFLKFALAPVVLVGALAVGGTQTATAGDWDHSHGHHGQFDSHSGHHHHHSRRHRRNQSHGYSQGQYQQSYHNYVRSLYGGYARPFPAYGFYYYGY
jgi:hypothetical protein